MKCPKCKTEMESGFLADTYGDIPGGTVKQEWGNGSKNWLGQLTTQKKVVTYCCPECGYLESYAKNE